MKKMLATLMSFVFVCSVCSITVLAVENSVTVSNNTMTFKTELLMSETAITAPAVDFTYTISTGDIYGTATVETITAPTIKTEAFTTSDFVDPTVATTTAQTLSKDVTVDFSNITWTTTGIYHYTITATDMSSVAGVVMDDQTTREIYVYVVESSTAGTYEISNIIMTTAAITDIAVTEDTTTTPSTYSLTNATKSTGFLNGYGVDPAKDPDDDDDDTYENFIVTVNVAGTMADKTKDFTVAITSTSGITTGTIFTVTDEDKNTEYIQWNGTNFVTATYTAGSDGAVGTWAYGTDEALSILLKDGETYTIHSVVNNMVFKTTITDEDNYTIYSNIDGATNSTDEVLILTNPIVADGTNDSNNYTPTYDLTIPDTSVILDILPYVIMVLLAAAFITIRIAVSIKKSRRD